MGERVREDQIKMVRPDGTVLDIKVVLCPWCGAIKEPPTIEGHLQECQVLADYEAGLPLDGTCPACGEAFKGRWCDDHLEADLCKRLIPLRPGDLIHTPCWACGRTDWVYPWPEHVRQGCTGELVTEDMALEWQVALDDAGRRH